MNKKIAILTLYYKNANYGAILQAYALQYALAKLGYVVKQISYDLESGYEHIAKWKRKLSGLRKLCSFFKNPRWKICNYKYESKLYEFAETIPHTEFVTADTIKKLNNTYDIFICGSDQIWNPIGWQPTLFLDFVDSDKKKIAYAASVARNQLYVSELKYIQNYTKNFTLVSVREEKSAEIINSFDSTLDVQVMPDPTLLLGEEEWKVITAPRVINEEYIFAYFLGDEEKQREDAIRFAKSQGKRIVFLPYMKKHMFKWDKKHKKYMIENVGIKEFLSLIRYSDIVITDSFHGTIFSIVFEKPFFVMNRFKENDANSMNSRLETLLEDIQMKYRCGDNLLENSNLELNKDEITSIHNYKNKAKLQGLEFLRKGIQI